jgi:hypothetical protein
MSGGWNQAREPSSFGLSNPQMTPESVAWEHRLLRELGQRTSLVTPPLAGHGNQSMVLHEGRVVSLFPYIDGAPPSDPAEWRSEAARTLGELHAVLASLGEWPPRPRQPAIVDLEWDNNHMWTWALLKRDCGLGHRRLIQMAQVIRPSRRHWSPSLRVFRTSTENEGAFANGWRRWPGVFLLERLSTATISPATCWCADERFAAWSTGMSHVPNGWLTRLGGQHGKSVTGKMPRAWMRKHSGNSLKPTESTADPCQVRRTDCCCHPFAAATWSRCSGRSAAASLMPGTACRVCAPWSPSIVEPGRTTGVRSHRLCYARNQFEQR